MPELATNRLNYGSLWPILDQGWGLLSQLTPFRYFPNLSALLKRWLSIEFHVYIWHFILQNKMFL